MCEIFSLTYVCVCVCYRNTHTHTGKHKHLTVAHRLMVLLFGVSHRFMAAVVVQTEYATIHVCGCSVLYFIVVFLQLCNGQNHSLSLALCLALPAFRLVLHTKKLMVWMCAFDVWMYILHMRVWHHRSQRTFVLVDCFTEALHKYVHSETRTVSHSQCIGRERKKNAKPEKKVLLLFLVCRKCV